MARLSKARFVIHEDTGIPTPDSETTPSFFPNPEDKLKSRIEIEEDDGVTKTKEGVGSNDLLAAYIEEDHDHADDERRESNSTTTSVSSVPDSIYPTDVDNAIPTHNPYTPPIIRPSFRRPESIRGMQMSSPRSSLLHKPRSRNSTPKRGSTTAKGSPRSRRWKSQDVLDEEDDQQEPQLPLVLLQVTLLPVDLPWTVESMQE